MDNHDAISEGEQPTTRSLRAKSSEPSLSHWDGAGDKNRSPSRKRPRLDSGSRSTRSMSADDVFPSLDKAAGVENIFLKKTHDRPTTPPSKQANGMTPVLTPSRVTINVREHPKDTTRLDSRTASYESKGTTKGLNGARNHVGEHDPKASLSTSSSGSASPPIEIIDLDSADPIGVVTEIREDTPQEDAIAKLFYSFPWAEEGNYEEAADMLLRQLDSGSFTT